MAAFGGIAAESTGHRRADLLGLFGKKKEAECPVCGDEFATGANVMSHNLKHTTPAPDGRPGFSWRCGCGAVDGVWDDQAGAAAGLTMHFQQAHGITPM